MVVLKIVHEPGKYQDGAAYNSLQNYIKNLQKTPSNLINGRGIDVDYAADEMALVAEIFGKHGVKVRHFILSFPSEKFSTLDVAKIAEQVLDYYSSDYQIMYAVHENKENPHAHFVMNMVSYQDGHRYRGTKQDYYGLQKYIQKILKPYGERLVTCNSSNDFDV